jgi:UDP-N-acetylenolpyruvoylglucosamine reductase
VQDTTKATILEVGAGENWHSFVAWTLDQGYAGLENLALIPGTVGAAPVQNIGAYGVELQDRFDSLDAVDLQTGQVFTLNAAQCAFGYRDSVFKHGGAPSMGLRDRAVITRVRFALPKAWKRRYREKNGGAGRCSAYRAAVVRLGVRHSARQAARPRRHWQRRQFFQKPDGYP